MSEQLFLAVKNVQAILGAYPYVTGIIFVDRIQPIVAEAVEVSGVMFELRNLLGAGLISENAVFPTTQP